MADPREYDREYTTRLYGDARRRTGVSIDQGEVTRFLVQLEYQLEGEWAIVVRYDHDAEGSAEMSHDVTDEGLHVDVYRDGEKVESPFIAPPMPADVALDLAEDHLSENLERYIRRFEEWHQ